MLIFCKKIIELFNKNQFRPINLSNSPSSGWTFTDSKHEVSLKNLFARVKYIFLQENTLTHSNFPQTILNFRDTRLLYKNVINIFFLKNSIKKKAKLVTVIS